MTRVRPLPLAWAAGLLFLSRSGNPEARETTDPADSAEALRAQIKQRVAAYPGLHLSEIARNLDVPTNHAKYHLRRLEEEGEVSSLKHDGYWRFFPKIEGPLGNREALGRREKRLLSFMRRPKPLQIMIHLLDRGDASHGEITDSLGVAGATAHHHLTKLTDAGILDRIEEGRHVFYSLADPDLVRDLLERYEPPDPLVEGFIDAWHTLDLG